METTFADIEELANRCRFSDCTHTSEPGCAVLSALEDGSLDSSRWNSYLKIKMELEYAADSESYLERKEQKFKTISKQLKHHK